MSRKTNLDPFGSGFPDLDILPILHSHEHGIRLRIHGEGRHASRSFQPMYTGIRRRQVPHLA